MHVVQMTLKYGSCCMTGEMCGYYGYATTSGRFGQDESQWLNDNFRGLVGTTLQRENSVRYGDNFYAKGATRAEAWQNCLAALQADANRYSYKGVQVRTFWFVDYEQDGAHYTHDELRQAVKALPGTVHMGEHRNSNTRNLLDCYMAVFKNEPREDDDEEEDDDD